MNRKEREQIFKGLESLTSEYDDFNKVMIKILKNSISIKTIKRISVICIICLIFLPLVYTVSYSDKTYDYIELIISSTDTIMLSLFAVTFTGYALFQALTSGQTLIAFLKQRSDKMSKFEEFNLSFFSLTLGYLFILSVNYILKIMLPIIKDFNMMDLFASNKNNIIIISIYLYLVFSIFLLLEMRSFIFNLFQCFNVNAISYGIKSLKDERNE